MNSNYIALSKVITQKWPTHGGGPFQKDFWLKFNDKNQFNERKEIISSKLRWLSKTDQEYFSIKIVKSKPNKIIAKSNIPEKVWEESWIEIRWISDNTLLWTWNKYNIEKLLSIVQQANYSSAKAISSSKKTRLSREVFVIEDIESVQLEDRLSQDLKWIDNELINDVILELYAFIKYQKAQSLINKIKDFLSNKDIKIQSITWVDSDIISNVSIRILISYTDLINLLNLVPEIQYAYLSPEIILQRAMKNSISVTRNDWSFLTDCIIWLFDQWVSDIFKFAIWQREKYASDLITSHWTLVTSKILFWEQLNRTNLPSNWNINLKPVWKILDIKILNENNGLDDINLLYEVIEKVINKYTNIYIYNFSLWFPQDKNHIHMLTTIIDNLASKYDKIFVISAWNSDKYCFLESSNNESYWDIINYLNNDSTHLEILAPADSINWISVWSIVEVVTNETISKNIWDISPLSRII